MKSGVVLSSISDHSLVFCILKEGVTKAKPRIIEFRSYKSYMGRLLMKLLAENVRPLIRLV